MPGLPKSIIKKYGISKKAWSIFRGSKKNSKPNKRKKTNMSNNRPIKKRKKNMTKRKKNRRSRGFLNFNTITKFIKIGALLGPGVYGVITGSDTRDKIVKPLSFYTGFNMNDGKFYWENLMKGWTPYIATSLIAVGISKLNGIIRRL